MRLDGEGREVVRVLEKENGLISRTQVWMDG